MADSDARECNPEAAVERLGGDADLYREVLTRFYADADNSVARLRRALETQNADEMHRAAHSFKGLAAMSGAERVARTAAELEQMGRNKQLEEAPPLVDRITIELQRSRLELAPHFE